MKPFRTFLHAIILVTLLVAGFDFAPLSIGAWHDVQAASSPAVDVVFAVDNTGSMGSTIDQVKTDIQYITDQIRATFSDSNFGVVKFRDYGEDYVTQVATDLTSDLTAVSAGINSMDAAGGGDDPEAYTDAIYTSVNSLSWRPGSVKLLVVIGDELPHDPAFGTGSNPNGWTWNSAASLAVNHGVRVSMVLVGGGVGNSQIEGAYSAMAKATNGLFEESPSPDQLANDLIALVQKLGNSPTVIHTSPANGDTNVSAATPIQATFSMPVNPNSLNAYNLLVNSSSGARVDGKISYNSSTNQVTFTPNAPLLSNTTYQVTLTNGIVGTAAGNNPLSYYSWTFTTNGTALNQLLDALKTLHDETINLIYFNADMTAQMMSKERARTHTDDLRMAAEWLLWYSDLQTGGIETEPAGLSDGVKALFKVMGKLGTAQLIADTYKWEVENTQAAPWTENEAYAYFLNAYKKGLPLQDQDGTVNFSATGLDKLVADIDLNYNATVAWLNSKSNPLSDSQMQTAASLIQTHISKMRAASNSEQYIGFYDPNSGAYLGDRPIGTITTQFEQFKQAYTISDKAHRINDAIFVEKVGVKVAKIATFSCTVAGAITGVVAAACGTGFAISEIANFDLKLIDAGNTVMNKVLSPDEHLLSNTQSAVAATSLEEIALRRYFNGIITFVKNMPSVSAAALHMAALTTASSPADQIDMNQFNLGDIGTAADAGLGTGSGSLQVTNHGPNPLTVTADISVMPNLPGNKADIVSLTTSDPVSVPPGSSQTIPFSLDLIAARYITPNGFEVHAALEILDPATGLSVEKGPFVQYITVGTPDEIYAFRANVPTLLPGAALGPGQVNDVNYQPTTDQNTTRFTLIQPSDADYDLHVYDSLGEHVGMNYTTGQVEIPEGARYTGRDVQRETIEIDSSKGPFTVRVVAIQPSTTGSYAVSAYEYNYVAPITGPGVELYLPVIENNP